MIIIPFWNTAKLKDFNKELRRLSYAYEQIVDAVSAGQIDCNVFGVLLRKAENQQGTISIVLGIVRNKLLMMKKVF